MSVLAPDDVTVAGLVDASGPPIAAHWSGSDWTVRPIPYGDHWNQWFIAVKAFSPTSAWAGGGGAYGILAARFSSCA